jgi:hypothetical protein
MPFYLDEEKGKIYLEISSLDKEFLYVNSLTAGVGSNDIGLDRGQLGDNRVVEFRRTGNKLLLVHKNYGFRAFTDNPYEAKSIQDAFAESVLWGFEIAQKDGRTWLYGIRQEKNPDMQRRVNEATLLFMLSAVPPRISEKNNFKKFDIYEGVNINRVRNIGKHHGSLLNRILFSIGFIFKSFIFLLVNRKRYDVLIITTNPPFLGVLVLILRLFVRIPYVVIAYDIYPQILDKMGILKKSSSVYKFWKWLNIKVYNNAFKVISIGEDMTEIIQREMCVMDRSKIELIYNWSDKNKVFPVKKANNKFIVDHGFAGKKILLYSGTMGSTHNIEDILNANKNLKF